MSTVRNAILALLTQGPAYGLQLRNELDRRLQRNKVTNVGQIYATLDRLTVSLHVKQVSTTDDGLPLYELTSLGLADATSWLKTPRIDPANRWESMVSQVSLARSLPNFNSSTLLRGTEEYWRATLERALEQYSHDLASDLRSSAEEQLCLAALAWLARVAETSDAGYPVSTVRPPKGRPALSAS